VEHVTRVGHQKHSTGVLIARGDQRVNSLEVEEDENKPRKKAKLEGPTEDYSKSYKKPEVKEESKGAKEKALAKSAKGTKNIMSFFGKK